MDTQILITCILSSTVAAAVITSIKELILWKLNRKAHKEDKAENKLEDAEKSKEEANSKMHQEILDRLDDITERLDSHKNAHKLILSYTIRQLGMKYLEEQEISVTDRNELIEMWKQYHYGFNGNGTHDDLMAEVRDLPTKTTRKEA